jgi:hypothetical protein
MQGQVDKTNFNYVLSTRSSLITNTYAWFIHVILESQESEIRRIKVQGQPRQIIPETVS